MIRRICDASIGEFSSKVHCYRSWKQKDRFSSFSFTFCLQCEYVCVFSLHMNCLLFLTCFEVNAIVITIIFHLWTPLRLCPAATATSLNVFCIALYMCVVCIYMCSNVIRFYLSQILATKKKTSNIIRVKKKTEKEKSKMNKKQMKQKFSILIHIAHKFLLCIWKFSYKFSKRKLSSYLFYVDGMSTFESRREIISY